MSSQGSILSDVSGVAALAICESLLLALNDRKILPEREIVGILEDAVAVLINKVIDGGNSVRRP